MLLDSKIKATTAMAQLADKQPDRESRERIELIKAGQEHERSQLQLEQEATANEHKMQMDRATKTQEMAFLQAAKMQELEHGQIERQTNMYSDAMMAASKHDFERQRHERELQKDAERHAQKMEHDRQLHEAKLAQAKAVARVTKAAKPAKKKKEPKKG